MKRSTFSMILTFVLGISTAGQASACLCLPYIPFLDPFAWLGFYGCGGGYGGGCGAGGYGGGYGGYGYAPSAQYGYAPQQMAYPQQMAPVNPGCSNCTGALPVPQQQAMTAVQVPVTTYRAVTQYVPQTTYQTQYRPAPTASVAYQPQAAVAYQPQQFGYQQAYGYQPAQTAYAAPVYGGVMNPTTAYNGMMPAQTAYAQPTYTTQSYATPSFETPYYTAPTFQPPVIASPAGDVFGDHEWPAQSAQVPVILNSHTGRVPVQPISYGVTPRSARTFNATVK